MEWFSTFFVTAFTREEIQLSIERVHVGADVETKAAAAQNAQGFDFVWRFLDEVMLDGWPVLFRAGLAFLTINEEALRRSTTKEQVLAVLLPYTHQDNLKSDQERNSGILSKSTFESPSPSSPLPSESVSEVLTTANMMPTWTTPTRSTKSFGSRTPPKRSPASSPSTKEDGNKGDGGTRPVSTGEDETSALLSHDSTARLIKLTHLAVGNPVAQSSLPSYLHDALSTSAPSNQWLRDARRPAWNEVHIVVAGWRRRMEQRSAAVLSVRSICQNLINTLTKMWALLPRTSESSGGELGALSTPTATAGVTKAAAAAATAAAAGEDPPLAPSSPPPASPGRGGQEAERRHLQQRLSNLRKTLISAMDKCHLCARRAIEASDQTCRMIDNSWVDLCAHEEEARKRRDGFDGFIAEHKSPSSARMMETRAAADVQYGDVGRHQGTRVSGKASSLFDPVFSALLGSSAYRSTGDSLCFEYDSLSGSPGSRSGSGSGADSNSTAVRNVMQKQMHAMADAVMATAWTCLATCWDCKHWLAKDMWWCCSWAANTHGVPSPAAALPMQLVGTEITSVPAKTASTNIGAAHHRRVCISVFETFYDTSTALAKATERLLRCDIAGQRSEVGPGAAVVLAPDLTGSAEPSALDQAVKQLGKLRRGLGLLGLDRSR